MKRFALLFALLVFPAAPTLAAGIDVNVSAQSIDIGALYNGATVDVSGVVPEGSQVAVRFAGAPEDVRMKQKGKALGLLWMNMNSLHFLGVPKVCLVDSSVPLAQMGEAAGKLGVVATADSVGIEPASADRGMLLPELIKLKQSEGLYRETTGGVKLGENQGGGQEASIRLAIPSRLSPGSYSIEVFAVKDGQIVAQGVKHIEARLVGIPAELADLAFNHGAWYGILASIVAIAAGLAIGLVFQSKEAH